MESHGSVSIMKRQSQHKTTGKSLWHVPLSARSEIHSHPLAEQAQACGRLTKAEGPECPIAPIVTTGGYSWEKTAFLTRHPCTGAMLICSVLFNGKKTSNCACHPCAGTMPIFSVSQKKKTRIMHVILAQKRNLTTPLGSSVRFALLDVLLRAPTFHPSRTRWVRWKDEGDRWEEKGGETERQRVRRKHRHGPQTLTPRHGKSSIVPSGSPL